MKAPKESVLLKETAPHLSLRNYTWREVRAVPEKELRAVAREGGGEATEGGRLGFREGGSCPPWSKERTGPRGEPLGSGEVCGIGKGGEEEEAAESANHRESWPVWGAEEGP